MASFGFFTLLTRSLSFAVFLSKITENLFEEGVRIHSSFPSPPLLLSLQLLCHSMLDDAADELEVVGGAADCGVHAGPDEGADGREAGGQRHAVLGRSVVRGVLLV